jgi:hypothetical protein
MNADADYKNTLPGEVDDHAPSDQPRQLRTQADNDRPLTRAEAAVAGMTMHPEVVYGESDEDPNRDDQIDAHRGSDAADSTDSSL